MEEEESAAPVLCLLNSGGTHSLQRIHWRASDIMLNFYKSVVLKRQAHLQSGQLARRKMSGMRSYNPEQIMLNAVVRRPSCDVNLMKEKLIFSEINNSVGSTVELSAYTGNGLAHIHATTS